MRKRILVCLIFFSLVSFLACNQISKTKYNKYTDSFFDTFDTVTVIMAYTKDKEDFDNYFNKIHERFRELHKLYDKYNNYDGVNNIKTINDYAGIKPIKVQKEIMDLIIFSKDWHKKTTGLTNIALGPVLEIWHEYRTEGIENPENAKIPPMEDLEEAFKNTNINKIILDIENSTVFLADKQMRIDVGAVAKGFATEIVAQEIMAQGMQSGIINAGGNVRTIGKPLDGKRERWGIGIQNPNRPIFSDDPNLDVAFIRNSSMANSGDYQRFYTVNNKILHHIINPKTLMPASYYQAVTVVSEDSGLVDFLSTEFFLLPYEESRALADRLDGVEVLWIIDEDTIEITPGMKKLLKNYGASDKK